MRKAKMSIFVEFIK